MLRFEEYAQDVINKIEVLDDCFSGRYKFYMKTLKNKKESYCSDLWACCRIGFITEEETVAEIKKIDELAISIITKVIDRLIEKVGEDEYTILWYMDKGYTREEAEKLLIEN